VLKGVREGYADEFISLVVEAGSDLRYMGFCGLWGVGARGTKMESIFNSLLAALARRVVCRILVDRRSTNAEAVRLLAEKKACVRHLGPGTRIHAKALIVDGRVCLFGSHNLTNRAMERNVELSLLTDDVSFVTWCVSVFEKVWKEAYHW